MRRQCFRLPSSTPEGTGRIRWRAEAMLLRAAGHVCRGVPACIGSGADRTCERVREIGLGDTLNAFTPSLSSPKRERRQVTCAGAFRCGRRYIGHLFCSPLVHRQAHRMHRPCLVPPGVYWRHDSRSTARHSGCGEQARACPKCTVQRDRDQPMLLSSGIEVHSMLWKQDKGIERLSPAVAGSDHVFDPQPGQP